MHKLGVILFFCFLSSLTYGQYIPEPEEEKEEKEEEVKDEKADTDDPYESDYGKKSFEEWTEDKLSVWGDVDFFANSFTLYFSVGPKLGYNVMPNLMVGPAFRYMFIKDFSSNQNLNIVGGGLYTTLSLIEDQFLIHLEYEALRLQVVQPNSAPPVISTANANLLLGGLGYRRDLGNFFYQGMLLYDFLQDPNAPYISLLPIPTNNPNTKNTIIFRLGFGYRF